MAEHFIVDVSKSFQNVWGHTALWWMFIERQFYDNCVFLTL